jgi:hydrogenase expression/formation protein HypE
MDDQGVRNQQLLLGHGGGGRLTAELIENVFLPAFANPLLAPLNDQAVFEVGTARLAFTTDSFVVKPHFFPGGDIGSLAVHGTVNDLAMAGARPLYLSAGFILEEGFPLAQLKRVVASMQQAARAAGVVIATGDTKVVERGHGDGIFINTAGVGVVEHAHRLSIDRARPGDAVLASGPIGDHGVAVLASREGFECPTPVESDSAPLHELVATLLPNITAVRCLRDPTRGGLASALNEIARASKVGILLDEPSIPVRPAVQGFCELLGLDPLYVACEGRLTAVVAAEHAEGILESLRAHPLGTDSVVIGRIVADHPGTVAMRTGIGGTRIVDLVSGEQLPRIC